MITLLLIELHELCKIKVVAIVNIAHVDGAFCQHGLRNGIKIIGPALRIAQGNGRIVESPLGFINPAMKSWISKTFLWEKIKKQD